MIEAPYPFTRQFFDLYELWRNGLEPKHNYHPSQKRKEFVIACRTHWLWVTTDITIITVLPLVAQGTDIPIQTLLPWLQFYNSLLRSPFCIK